MKNTIYKIRMYKELKADIRDIEIRLQEIEEEILGVSGQGTEERTGKTYKITSSVEQQAEKLMDKKDELLRIKTSKEREIQRIDNAMTILLDEEREIIQVVHIDHKKYWRVEEMLNLTYSRIKQIEKEAIEKMKKYIA